MSIPLEVSSACQRHDLFRRFWQTASGFWRGPSAPLTWSLSGLLLAGVLLDLLVKYGLNVWTREFFDALERRDAATIRWAAEIFPPLAACAVALAVLAVWGRMTMQRRWRAWLTEYLVDDWLTDGRCHRLDRVDGDQRNPEYRIVEDARVATDAPVDFAVGLLTSVLTGGTFIGVLWDVGGALSFNVLGWACTLPGYLVVAAGVFAALTSSAMLAIANHLTLVMERRTQVESELRYEATRLREDGWHAAARSYGTEEGRALRAAFDRVLTWWRELCWQLMRTTLISQGNVVLGPVVALLLCAPKYLAGTMSLGEVTQVAAAFVIVQGAFNWLVDNYARLAEWIAAVHRVAALLIALDRLKQASGPPALDSAPS